MTKASSYLRDLTQNEINDLQKKYEKHLRRTRGGFLENPVKERLLRITNWEEDVSNDAIYQYFYDVREHTKTAIGEMQLLCDVLNEEQLQMIFGTKQDKPLAEPLYPIVEVLSSLIPTRIQTDDTRDQINMLKREIRIRTEGIAKGKYTKDNVKEEQRILEQQKVMLKKQEFLLEDQEVTLKEQEWRKLIFEDITIRFLQWYYDSGIFKTDIHRRIIIDTMDVISIMSSGKKLYLRERLRQFSS